MNAPTAEIISLDGETALLRVDSPVACARCAAGKGCGAGLLAGSRSPREVRVAVPGGLGLRQGDRVQLTMLPSRLLQATLYAYGLPLAALTLVPLLANAIWGPLGDVALVLLAAGAMVAAVLTGRYLLARRHCLKQLVPDIVGRAPAGRP